jgi:4-hydroxy-tetrahydrodipicolinate reductase
VAFTGPSEVIRIEHQALDRVLFGQGAIRAAFWLLGKPAGLYTIQQTLE